MALMRSLADDLRARPDDQLAALILARPDLIHPVPADIAALAQRAGSPASVAACLRGYDQWTLHVLLAAALGPDTVRPDDVAATMTPAPGAPSDIGLSVGSALARLREDALIWGDEGAWRLVGAARDHLVPADRGPRVAALDHVVASYARQPHVLAELLAGAPAGVAAALDRLLAGPVIGTVVNARRKPDPLRSPVDWMLAHHILVPLGTDRAVLPAEVVAIRRDTPPDDPARSVVALSPPEPAGPEPDPARIDADAVGAIIDVLHRTTELGLTWAVASPARLRTGGIALRELARTARALGAGDRTSALIVEVAAAAGLVAPDAHEVVTFLPTPAFDAWSALPPPDGHAALLRAWLDMPRAVATADQRPLAPELLNPQLPALRREVLAVLARSPRRWQPSEVLAALDWWAPRRIEPARHRSALAILEQCQELGLLVAGALTTAGRALAGPEPDAVATALERSLPGHVDQLVLQADLTAIVPGLPTPALAELMRAVADPESTGAASVYRFSAASIRRALDGGRTAAELHAELGRRGTLPQPLTYLIDDVARRHAALRIGAAATYLRCDDPVVLSTILADSNAAGLGLFRLSDTVIASAQPPDHVLERMRALGHSPQPDPGRGPQAHGPRRARRRLVEHEPVTTAITPALAAAAVRAIRASDRPSRATAEGIGGGDVADRPAAGRTGGGGTGGGGTGGGGTGGGGTGGGGTGGGGGASAPSGREAIHPVPTTNPAEVVAALRSAIAADRPVWIGYAEPTGVAGDRHVEPLRLAGGYLTALDLRAEVIASFALARITGVQTD